MVPGQLWLGTKPEDIGLSVRPGADHYGELQAWDPATGKKAWSHNFAKSQLFGSVTATAGDLVFAGGTNDRISGPSMPRPARCCGSKRPTPASWACRSPMKWMAPNISPIQSGWGVDAQRIQDALAGDNIGIESNVPQGGVVWVFAVKK